MAEAETTADPSRAWLADVVERGGDVVYVIRTRPDLAVEYVSDSVVGVSGFQAHEYLADAGLLLRQVDPQDAERLVAALATPPGEHVELELRWVHRDGHGVWLRHRARCVERPDGSRVLEGVAHDVSDLRAAQERLAESEARYRMLAENASDFVVMFTPDGRIGWASPSLESVLGWRPDQVLGQPAASFLHPDLVDELAGWRADANAGAEVSGRSRLRTADGSYRWCNRTLRALRDDDGSLIGRIAGFHDIQREVEAEEQLARREREARDIAENSADVVLRTTPDGVIDWVSPSVSRVLGWEPDELVGRVGLDFIHPDSVPEAVRTVARVNAGEAVRGRSLVRRKDGSHVWMDQHVKPVLDDGGQVVARVSGWRDASAEVAYEQRLAESERRYRLLAENSSDIVWLGDTDAVLRWVSPSVRDVLGWEPEALVGRWVASLLHPDDVAAMRAASESVNEGQRADYEARCQCADGSYRWMAITLRPVTDDSGTVVGRVAAGRDVETERRTRLELARSEELFRTAMESAPAGMAVVSPDRRFVEVNPALSRLLGRSQEWLERHGISDVLDVPDDEIDRAMRSELLATGARSETREHRMVRSDGVRIWVEHSIGVVRDDAGQLTSFVSQFVDVTESRHAREQLRFLATHDPLTELANRSELIARVDGLLSRTPRTGESLAVLFLDLDGLKTLNDTYGHAVGDGVIREVASRIRSQVRADDLVSRYGGDEFVAVLPAVHVLDDAVAVAGKVLAAFAEPIRLDALEILVSVSIGVALAQPDDDPDALLKRADAALYQAKREGRDRVVAYRDAAV